MCDLIICHVILWFSAVYNVATLTSVIQNKCVPSFKISISNVMITTRRPAFSPYIACFLQSKYICLKLYAAGDHFVWAGAAKINRTVWPSSLHLCSCMLCQLWAWIRLFSESGRLLLNIFRSDSSYLPRLSHHSSLNMGLVSPRLHNDRHGQDDLINLSWDVL